MFAQMAYMEGDQKHPFLEEAVSLTAEFFERTKNHRSALTMTQTLLSIQERIFAEQKPRKELLKTY